MIRVLQSVRGIERSANMVGRNMSPASVRTAFVGHSAKNRAAKNRAAMNPAAMVRAALGWLFLSLAALVLMAPAARADTRAVYTITNIAVDEQADSNIAAQENAFAAARIIAARRMLEKITLPEDRGVAGGLQIDYELARRLAAAVDIVEENRGGNVYRGKLSVVLNPVEVRAYLEGLGVPYVDRQAPLALLVVDAGSALAYALENENMYALAPWKIARVRGEPTDDADYSALQAQAGAQRVILIRNVGTGSAARAELTLWTPGGVSPFGSTRPSASPAEIAVSLTDTLDTSWKEQAIVRSDTRTIVQVTVRYTGIADWVSLRESLSRSPLVSQFQIEALASDGAVVAFTFAGDVERLKSDLLQRGVTLETAADGWVMRTASASAAAQRQTRTTPATTPVSRPAGGE